MWKRVFLVGLAVALAPVVRAEAAEPSIDQRTVRQAIALFRQKPGSPQAQLARNIIVRFAEASPDVEIEVSRKTMPWLANEKVPREVSATLVAAYMAGGTLSQLDRGKAKDDTGAGMAQVIATYRQLQQAQPALKVLEVERVIDLRKQGKLTDHPKAP